MTKRHKMTARLLVTATCLLLAAMLYAGEQTLADQSDGKMYVGNEMCLECHDDVGENFDMTSHGTLLSGSAKYNERSCEACHGPGSVHVDEMDPASIINPARLGDDNQVDPCLECHGGSKYYNWEFSPHATEDMTCSDCHQVHKPAGQSMKKPMPELCYDCHSDVRAAFYMPSHHPVEEGKMSCMDCHQIHGSEASFAMIDDDGRQQCFACHVDKEGPFLFEHDPVNEDCGVCHQPHGSVANGLLTQAEPALCLNCHSMHFHATIPGVDSANLESPQQPGRFFDSSHDGFKQGMLTKCTQCHTQIHGSDLPAQSISGQGGQMTR
jgi:DmsE family decaheme c-type cytochrome